MAGGGRMEKKKKGRTWDLIPGPGRQKLGVLTTALNIRMSFLMPPLVTSVKSMGKIINVRVYFINIK